MEELAFVALFIAIPSPTASIRGREFLAMMIEKEHSTRTRGAIKERFRKTSSVHRHDGRVESLAFLTAQVARQGVLILRRATQAWTVRASVSLCQRIGHRLSRGRRRSAELRSSSCGNKYLGASSCARAVLGLD